jgi:hypothetical protein
MSNSWQGPGSYTASEVEEIVEHSRRTPRHLRAAPQVPRQPAALLAMSEYASVQAAARGADER